MVEVQVPPFRIAPGFGLRVLSQTERLNQLAAITDTPGPVDLLQVWEPPRKGQRYVISADVSHGLELDNSVLEVTRIGTITEPDEQVAQFVSGTIDATDLAYYIDALGRFYTGRDSLPALAAIECNGMGIATQNELIKHLGYQNLYIWQYLDSVEGHEFTTRYGWYTNQRTRPIMLQKYHHSVKTVDRNTGIADYRINSPWTIHELASFVSPGPLYMAEAADGEHDDCIMAGAIGLFVAQTVHYDQRETVHETRRRLSEEMQRVDAAQKIVEQKISPQTTDVDYDSLMGRDKAWDVGEYDAEDDVTIHYR